MIKEENIKISDVDFVRRYSDSNLMIRKVNTTELYVEAIDILGSDFEYEETEEEISVREVI